MYEMFDEIQPFPYKCLKLHGQNSLIKRQTQAKAKRNFSSIDIWVCKGNCIHIKLLGTITDHCNHHNGGLGKLLFM